MVTSSSAAPRRRKMTKAEEIKHQEQLDRALDAARAEFFDQNGRFLTTDEVLQLSRADRD